MSGRVETVESAYFSESGEECIVASCSLFQESSFWLVQHLNAHILATA